MKTQMGTMTRGRWEGPDCSQTSKGTPTLVCGKHKCSTQMSTKTRNRLLDCLKPVTFKSHLRFPWSVEMMMTITSKTIKSFYWPVFCTMNLIRNVVLLWLVLFFRTLAIFLKLIFEMM